MGYKTVQLGNTLQQQYEADPRLLMAMQSMQQGGSSAPVQSPLEGLARALQGPLGAYMAKKLQTEYQGKQQDQYGAIADILAPPTSTATNGPQQTAPLPGGGSLDYSTPQISNTPNPNRDSIIAAMSSGIVKPGDFSKSIADNLGFGEPKAPTKVSPGDVLLGPDNKTPIYTAPFKPDKPEATPDSIQIAKALYPNDPAKQNAYLEKNQPANLRAISNVTVPKQNWQILTDPKTQTQYRYDLDSGKALTLDGQPFTPGGAAKINGGGTARSPAALAASMYVQEHPNASAQDVAQFAADYGKTIKSNAAFATGKQGDLVRSFNVAVSHLNTLDGLVDALGNGDVQALNKFGNAIAQQTGKPAPTNFDAAKAIVGDEIIKAIVGGGGALADRENAQNQISRANSPAQLRGVIATYKDLMAGQLRGLKKQYTDTTGRDDFDKRLSPEAIHELEQSHGAAPHSAPSKKTVRFEDLP